MMLAGILKSSLFYFRMIKGPLESSKINMTTGGDEFIFLRENFQFLQDSKVIYGALFNEN